MAGGIFENLEQGTVPDNNLSPVSLTPMINTKLQISPPIFLKIEMPPRQ
jgi:hypothetical protein